MKPPWLRRLNAAARALAPALLAGVLAACSSLSPPDATSIDGRLAVQVEASGSDPARSMSAPFTLRGDEKAGSFEIATPLGTMLARATWQPSAATLKTIDAERHYATLDELASDMLGESLPMAALMQWLRGRPWQGAPYASTAQPEGFAQLGWQINLARVADGLVVAERKLPAPAITVRAKIDPRP